MALSCCKRLSMLLIRLVLEGLYLLRYSYGYYQYDILGQIKVDDGGEMAKLKFDPEFIVGVFYFQFAFTLLFLLVLAIDNKEWYQFLLFFTALALLSSLFAATVSIVVKTLYNVGEIDFGSWNAKLIDSVFIVSVMILSLVEIVYHYKANTSMQSEHEQTSRRRTIDVNDAPNTSRVEDDHRVTSFVNDAINGSGDSGLSSAPPFVDYQQQQQHQQHQQQQQQQQQQQRVHQQPGLSLEWLEMQNNDTITANNLEVLFGPPPAYKP